MNGDDKPLVWLEGEIKTPPFSIEARIEVGTLLRRLQHGENLGLPRSRPMPSIGQKMSRIRISDGEVSWRIIYRIDADAIIIGEVFAKKNEQNAEKGNRLVQAAIQAIRRGNRMRASKRRKLEAAGWKVGSASEFLELNDAEEMLVNMKMALATNVKAMRQQQKLTQQELAKRIGSKPIRVAKMEVADSSVSMELFVRSLAALGASRTQIGKIVGTRVAKSKHVKTSKRPFVKT